jgi:hypothetical protein
MPVSDVVHMKDPVFVMVAEAGMDLTRAGGKLAHEPSDAACKITKRIVSVGDVASTEAVNEGGPLRGIEGAIVTNENAL